MDRLIIEDKKDAEALRWVQFAVCADPDRPRISGMYIHNDDDKQFIAGVDGFRMHLWHDVPTPLSEVLSGSILRINHGCDIAKGGWRVYPCKKIDEDFPAIDQIKPRGRLRAVFTGSPRFLRNALDVPQRGKQSFVVIRVYGPEDPLIIESLSERRVVGHAVVMPMHWGLANQEDKTLAEKITTARRAQVELEWIREHYPDVAMEAEEKAKGE
jgi:hypothetical protein